MNGTNSKKELAIINSSREIIFASEKEDFAEQSRMKAESVRSEINKFR
jgi:hypothetical protein